MEERGHEQAGLRFFGKVSASISHEMRNALAGIQENAGLLSDLSALAAKGSPVDLGRFQRIAERVTGLVRRADTIVRDMNAFSHSIDVESTGVDLRELIALVIRLYERIAAARGWTIHATLPSAPLQVTTVPFFQEHLLWALLEAFTARRTAARHLEIRAEARDETLCIRLHAAKVPPFEPGFPGAEVRTLARKLKAGITLNPNDGEILLTLPRSPAGPKAETGDRVLSFREENHEGQNSDRG